ncbi:unnamed protein product [Owenia fusiformis]|uniref:WSC domain-containing protein n=1 Tax=Owenia fusiformis TaxID=6347 RepID=A0A8S4Q4S7_OWEFU|nr:unnamed protein product [Owenia fusiformis]
MDHRVITIGYLFLDILPIVLGTLYGISEGVFHRNPDEVRTGIPTANKCLLECQLDDTCQAVAYHGDTLQCDFHITPACLLDEPHAYNIYRQEETHQLCPTYIGCFIDATNTRDLSNVQGYFPSSHATPNTLEFCESLCRPQGFQYIGLQNGQDCWCSNSYGNHGEVPDSDCNTACPGDPNTMCGGVFRNSIYRIIY